VKKYKKLALQLMLLSSAIALSACSSVAVYDKEVCADLGNAGAHCAHTYVTEKRRDIEKSKWDKERVGWMCMKAEDFSDTEDSIDELCRTKNICDFETKQKLEQIKSNMAPLLESSQRIRSEEK